MKKIKQIIKAIISWLSESNRYLHLLCGFALGLLSIGWYCALLASVSTAAALEYKDFMYHGKQTTAWDWIDFGLTIAGAVLGYGVIALTNGLC